MQPKRGPKSYSSSCTGAFEPIWLRCKPGLTPRGAIVLNLCAGSGSTVIAAHKTGWRSFACELDPLYCDQIIRLWGGHTVIAALPVSTLRGPGRSRKGPSSLPAWPPR